MSEQTPVDSGAEAPPVRTPGERLSTAADKIVHEAQTRLDKATAVAGDAFERLSDEAEDVRERAGQSAENVVDDLRGIGSRLAAALQAAASTPEAENLKGDIREGAQRLVNELQAVIKASPIGKMGGRSDTAAEGGGTDAPAVEGVADVPSAPSTQRMATTVRTELANALRGLNRALDRLAGQLQPPAAVVDVSAQPAPSGASDDAPTA